MRKVIKRFVNRLLKFERAKALRESRQQRFEALYDGRVHS